jgi:hypothetical protein
MTALPDGEDVCHIVSLLTYLYYKNRMSSTVIFVIQQLFMSPKAGRPKVPKDKAKAPGISVRLTQDESRTIRDAIKHSGLSQSDWARKSLIYIASNGIRIT